MEDSSVLSAMVVGAGLGGSLSITAIQQSDRYELVGVADVRPEARDKYADQTATFSSYQEMFAARSADVVCVSTYAPSHLDIVRAALDLPVRGLLVEKPLADTTARGKEILDLARDARIPVVVPHGLMAMSGPREVLERVRSGAIGDLRLMEIECANWDIINAGIHWLQFFVALVHPEPVSSVLAACDTSTRTFRDGLQVETEAVVMARCRNGVRVVMNTGDYLPIAREKTGALFRIVGTTGVIEYAPWAHSYTITPDGEVTVPPWNGSGHQRHLERLAELIENGETDDFVPNTSLQALELVEASYLSHRTRAAVTLPLADYTPPDATDWEPGAPYSGVGGGRDGRTL